MGPNIPVFIYQTTNKHRVLTKVKNHRNFHCQNLSCLYARISTFKSATNGIIFLNISDQNRIYFGKNVISKPTSNQVTALGL